MYDGLIIASALAFLAAALVVVLAVPSTPHAPPPVEGSFGYRALLRDRPYLALIGTCAIFALCSMFLALSLPVYVVQGLSGPDWAPGPLLALNTLLLATCTAAVTRFVRRRCTRVRAMVWAGGLWVLWCAASAGAALLPSRALVPFLVAVVVCYTVAEMTYGPASNALAADAAPSGSRGTYLPGRGAPTWQRSSTPSRARTSSRRPCSVCSSATATSCRGSPSASSPHWV
ncbi:MFS transporter [Streptomyces phaeochromogenes]